MDSAAQKKTPRARTMLQPCTPATDHLSTPRFNIYPLQYRNVLYIRS